MLLTPPARSVAVTSLPPVQLQFFSRPPPVARHQ